MATTYLTRTQSSGNRKTWTFSVWLKRANIDGDMVLFKSYTSANDHIYLRFNSNNDMYMESATGGASKISFTTNRKFRDCNAYYHIVLKVDMTQATSTDRWKLYINGVDEATIGGYSDSSYASQNDDLAVNLSGATMYIGSNQTPSEYFDGIMSHIHFTDGTAYTASTFGSTDATTGEWEINTSPTMTMGTNGFTILKDGNTITDQSSNSNDFTLGGGTLTNTEDCPSDVFATLNPLGGSLPLATFSNGNLTIASNTTQYQSAIGTIGVPTTGNWYWEYKCLQTTNGATGEGFIGAVLESSYSASSNPQELRADGITISVTTNFSAGDIASVEVDRTNNTLKIFKNGSSTAILTKTSLPNEIIFPYVTCYGSGTASVSTNFGNGYFGTTAISSEGTNASSIGKFEYDVPTGYTALSTKGLNS